MKDEKRDRMLCLLFALAFLTFNFQVVAGVSDFSYKKGVIYYTTEKRADVTIKIYDVKGKYLRTILNKAQAAGSHAARWDGEDNQENPVDAGRYTVRISVGLQAVFDKTFGDKGVLKFSPSVCNVETDAKGDIYVFESGVVPSDNKNARPSGHIYKYHGNGKSAKDFLASSTAPPSSVIPVSFYIKSMKVGPTGNIFLSHGLGVTKIDNQGKTQYQIMQRDAKKPGWTINASGLALGANNKVYIYLLNRRITRVYDRSQSDSSGYLYSSFDHALGSPPDLDNKGCFFPRMDADVYGNIWSTSENDIRKCIDSGESIVFQYALDLKCGRDGRKGSKDGEFSGVIGLCHDGQGGIWVADRNNSRVQKLWDSGSNLRYAWQFGSKGSSVAKNQFMAPRDVALSPDGKSIYVLEDGCSFKRGKFKLPIGQHQLTKYNLKYDATKIISINRE